ncbi:MAG: hypothetical protein KJ804_17485 [Proteobacteria bacterium]|nr:hypothetical protein [Pseudomonadota bacterium]MBU1060100.1 hypothetical protein [Pseudomonadota bacterium]
MQKKHSIAALIFFIVSIFLTAPSMAEWQQKGPEGTQVRSLIGESGQPSVLYAGTNGGIYKSTDAGLTWSYKALRFRGSEALHQAPASCGSQLINGSWSTVYSSADSGENWGELATLDSGINDIVTSSACISYFGTGNGIYGSNFTHGLAGEEINTLAIDSADTVYAGTDGGEIYKSTDDGSSWTLIRDGEAMVWDIITLAPDHIFATSLPSGILESTDGGATWTARTTGLPDVEGSGIHAVNTIGSGSTALYAAVTTSVSPLSTAVYKSVDNGLNWTATASGASKEYEIWSIIVNSDNTVYLGTDFGVLKSSDGGNSWLDLGSAIQAVPTTHSMVENSSGTLLVGSDGGGIYRSTDNGMTWVAAGSGAPGRVEAILVDRTDTLYCSNNQTGGIYKSIDNGLTWNPSSTGLPSEPMGSITLYHEVHSLTQGGNSRIYAALEGGEIFYSDDQGTTWTATTPLPGVTSEVSSIVAGAGGLVYAGTEGDGVYKSSDGGINWSQNNAGLPPNPSVSRNGIILDSTSGDLFLPLSSERVYRSIDGGENWVVADPAIGCGSAAITMDRAKNLYGVFCNGAVYKSSDNGDNWTDMSEGLGMMDNVEGINIQGIFADSQDTLLLSTSSNGIYRFSNTVFQWNLFLPAILGSRH